MGRPLKIKTPEDMERLWEDYKADCDNQEVLTHDFSSKNSEFVSAKLKRSVTYTIEGFCVFVGIPSSLFYDTYPFKTGTRQTFYDNHPFINWQELNRIEEACRLIYSNIQSRYNGRKTISFTLNGGAF